MITNLPQFMYLKPTLLPVHFEANCIFKWERWALCGHDSNFTISPSSSSSSQHMQQRGLNKGSGLY